MTINDLTPRQREVLQHIEQEYLKTGVPPSMREIGDAMGISSLNAVARHLTNLTSAGWLQNGTGSRQCVPVRVTRSLDVKAGRPAFQPIVVQLPIRIHSRANKREHWTVTAKRDKREKQTVAALMPSTPPPLPVKVTLTRSAPRFLDGDNLQGGMKAVRDAVAAWLGADDRDGSGITWAYEQARSTTPKTYAAQILIEPGEA